MSLATEQMKKTLYLVRGTSGAGKSTFVSSILQDGDVAIANDDYMVNEHGAFEFDWRRLDEVGEKAREATERAMEDGTERIFVHNTFTRESELEPYMALADKHAYRVVSLIVENRHGSESAHDVPESTLEKQRNRFDIKL